MGGALHSVQTREWGGGYSARSLHVHLSLQATTEQQRVNKVARTRLRSCFQPFEMGKRGSPRSSLPIWATIAVVSCLAGGKFGGGGSHHGSAAVALSVAHDLATELDEAQEAGGGGAQHAFVLLAGTLCSAHAHAHVRLCRGDTMALGGGGDVLGGGGWEFLVLEAFGLVLCFGAAEDGALRVRAVHDVGERRAVHCEEGEVKLPRGVDALARGAALSAGHGRSGCSGRSSSLCVQLSVRH